MMKLRKRKSLKSKKNKRCGGNGCRKCECGGEMHLNNKSGVKPYCICKTCGKSYFVKEE
jgi:hypothetical protein